MLKKVMIISWKNVWRSRLRSSVIVASIMFGLLGGIFSIAFMNGFTKQSVNNEIKTGLSHIQIHNKQYLLDEDAAYTVKDVQTKKNKIRKLKQIKRVASRIKVNAMASSASKGEGIILNGIEPEEESKITTIHKRIIEGDYFKRKMRNPAVIGKELADNLKLRLHSKFVVTFVDKDGVLKYESFRVAGIYKTENTRFEKVNVFVKKDYLSNSINFENGEENEISVLLTKPDSINSVKKSISQILGNSNLAVRSWDEINPALKMMNEMTSTFSYFFLAIIMLALSFGIINTMLMAVLERTREFGMLMAIGMNKLKLFLMIFFETLFLSVTGGILGILLSILVINVLLVNGIDLSIVAEGLNAYGYSSLVYPEINTGNYLVIFLLVVIMSIISSLFPSKRALKLNPAEAVRIEN